MISALAFFGSLAWIDGRPLQIEPYRREIFRRALDTYREDGLPQFSMVLAGRAKKNHKSSDLILAGLFVLVCRESPQGSDVLLVANDKDQADQDLDLAKKIIAANPDLAEELEVLAEEIRRRDGKGTMRILPANNVLGQHGKTAAFVGFDEVHGYRDHSLFEALAPDPTRYTLTWITSYDTIFDVEGVPLHDLKEIGKAGSDPRMLFSWYSGDYCTDPNFANLPPEERANPSMASWPEGKGYIEQQRRRLPSSRFRRLHLNMPGAPQGAHFDQATVERAIVRGRQEIAPQPGIDYLAFVDMSGGSSDDATLGIAHWDGKRAVLDVVINQGEAVPFNPRLAVARFAVFCRRYRCKTVHGDAYAGETFRRDFADCGIDYLVEKKTRTDLYESLEVALNADQVELLDVAKLHRELLTIVARGTSLDHMPGQHDDWATAAAGALTLVNPDLGNAEPGILEFYRRQSSEASAASAAAPSLKAEHGHQAIMQAFTPTRSDLVRVVAPSGAPPPSQLIGISGAAYVLQIAADGEASFEMSANDARSLCCGTNIPWREANPSLFTLLGRAEPPLPGVRVVDLARDLEAARPRSIFDRGGIAHDALRQVGRWPQ